MPSSLIFAALAVAWLVVLVPMIAKRRQEVVRTTESALASRVLPRPGPPRSAPQHGQEMPMVSGRMAQREPAPQERRYRSGRGGYD
ncbi:MAG: gephyrin-like molybdotransferase receptor GlpR, partial [Pseudonocardiaceae bacterium]